MTKFFKSSNSHYQYPLPSGFRLIYDLVPFFTVTDHFQNTNLSPEARKRLKWMDYYRQCQNISQTCRHFDISRKTFYYWLKRYDPHNLFNLEEKDRTPHQKRQREITPLPEERIILKVLSMYPSRTKTVKASSVKASSVKASSVKASS